MNWRLKIFYLGGLLELGFLCFYAAGRYKFFINDYNIPSFDARIWLILIIIGAYLTIIYSVVYWQGRDNNWPSGNLFLYVSILVFSSTLIAAWPMFSSDIFTYIMHGRVLGLYHANPYLVSISHYAADQIFPWVYYKWLETPMAYGPFWALLSAFLAKISGNDIIHNLFIFRLFAVVFYLVSVYLLDKILILLKSSHRQLILYLYAWNPLLLIETVNNGHNDIIMVALVLLAFYFYLKNKLWLVLPIFILACLIKYIFILLLPFVILLLIKKNKKKLLFLLGNFLIAIFLFFVIFLPWNLFPGLMGSIKWQSHLFWPGYLSLLPSLLTIFSHDHILIKNICTIIFIIFYLILFILFFKKKNIDFFIFNQYIIYILGGYLLIASFLINEWYVLWLLPFLLIADKKRCYWLLLIATLSGLLTNHLAFLSLIFIIILAAVLILRSFYYAFKQSVPN